MSLVFVQSKRSRCVWTHHPSKTGINPSPIQRPAMAKWVYDSRREIRIPYSMCGIGTISVVLMHPDPNGEATPCSNYVAEVIWEIMDLLNMRPVCWNWHQSTLIYVNVCLFMSRGSQDDGPNMQNACGRIETSPSIMVPIQLGRPAQAAGPPLWERPKDLVHYGCVCLDLSADFV